MLVSIDHLVKIYLGNPVLQQVNASIEDDDRIGLIGANGAGKSTLLRLICGMEYPDEGSVACTNRKTIGYLQQNSGLESSNSIYEEMRLVFSDLLQIQRELKQIEHSLSSTDVHENSSKYELLSKEYAEKQTYFEQQDGYLIDVKIQTILNGMGFSDKPGDTLIQTLSGGEKTRLAMAKLLLEQPDLLILDEPTNHLDFKTLMWLEEYLQSYQGALLIVSHDRYFLDKCVTKIWEIENKKLTSYKGNYSKYTRLKAEAIERQQKEYEIQQKQIADMQEYIDRNMARASTAKSARSRLNALERMELVEKPFVSEKQPRIRFTYEREPVKDVLDVSGLRLEVGQGDQKKRLAECIDLHMFRGDKIAIIGENGIGKSSFLKAIQSLIPVSKGRVEWGPNVRTSYYRQEMDQLNPENTVLEELWSRFPRQEERQIRSELGAVLLVGENVFKKVGVISGGEKAKLSLAILMQEHPNFLIMDEPTNHLDLRTKEVLEQSLMDFTGTILMVSHDRYLLNKVPNKILEMRRDGVHLYQGKFNDYLAAVQLEQATTKENVPEKPKNSSKQQAQSRQQRVSSAKIRARLRELERLIEETENKISNLEEQTAQPEVYENYKKMNEVCGELEEQKHLYNNYFEEWAELSEQIE